MAPRIAPTPIATMDQFFLPGVGRIFGRAPTLAEYELSLAFLQGKFGDDPRDPARRVQIRSMESTIRRLRWAAQLENEEWELRRG